MAKSNPRRVKKLRRKIKIKDRRKRKINKLISNGKQISLTPAAVIAIVNATTAPSYEKEKVARAMHQLGLPK